jgi:hypothetical protein
MASVIDLGQKVKAKYPGQYDDLPDAEVGRKVKARFPGQYDDFADEVQAVASHTPGEAVQPDVTPGGMALGGLEGATSIGTGLVAYPAGLAASAVDLARGKGMDAARKQRALVQQGLTYTPRTPEGQGLVSAVGRLMAPWTKSAEYVGKKVGDATGLPTLGGMAEEGFGAVVNPVTPFIAGKGLQRTTVPVPPRLTRTPAAIMAEREGVKGLTTGQMSPTDSIPYALERASADQPFGLAPQRNAAKESFVRAAQDKGVAPGAKPSTTNDLQTRLGELFDQYGPVYDPLKQHAVAPDVLEGLRGAASMPRRGIDARTIAGAKAEIENALSVLGPEFAPAKPHHAHGHGAPTPGPQPFPPGTILGPNGQPLPPPPPPPLKASVGDLIKARENIRTSKRSAGGDFDKLRLLDAAEDEFTSAIESALPPPERALLQQADRQYARLMQAATAAPAGQTMFTPGQYLRRVEKSAGARNFKKGRAGDTQDLGEAAREVLADAPMTGFRVAGLSALPAAKYWGAPVSRVLNSPAGRRYLFAPRERVTLTGSPDPVAMALAEAMSSAPASSFGLPSLRLDPFALSPAQERDPRRSGGGR